MFIYPVNVKIEKRKKARSKHFNHNQEPGIDG